MNETLETIIYGYTPAVLISSALIGQSIKVYRFLKFRTILKNYELDLQKKI